MEESTGSTIVKCLPLCVMLCSLASPRSSHNEAKAFLLAFDNSYYRPQDYSLRDFKVETRIDGLTERLTQQLIFGKLDDIFFELSWLAKGNESNLDYKKVSVTGLPAGFFEIKSQLAKNVLPRIDFVVPASLLEKMKDYKLEMTIDKEGARTIICRDLDNMKDANEIILVFDQRKRLARFIVKRSIGLETVDLKLVKEPWSQGKWVLSEYNVKKVHGVQTIHAMSTLDYKVVAGYGLPERIETKMRAIVPRKPSAKSNVYEGEIVSSMRFSNWKVNKGLKKSEFRN